MPMFVFLIVVVSLACGSAQPRAVALAPCLAAVAAVVSLWVLLSRAAADRATNRIHAGGAAGPAADRLRRQLEWLRWAAIAGAMVCLLGFGLAAAVQTWPVVSQVMVLQAIVLLAPAHLLIATTVWAESRFDVAMGRAATGFIPAARDLTAAMVRLDGWMLAPILTMLALSDLLGLLPAPYAPSAGVALLGATLLCVPVLVPWTTKRVWRTRPLDSDEHRWIAELIASAGSPRLDVRLWDTGMTSANAVVVGFFPRLRSLLLTDRIVRDLPAEQLKLIVLHELAHIRRGHLWLRLLAVSPGWLAAAALIHRFGTGTAVLLLSNGAAITTTLVLLRLAAHRTEFDADRTACELAIEFSDAAVDRRRSAGDAHATAESLCAALRWMSHSTVATRRASWLHPSVDARCARLRAWADREPAGEPIDAAPALGAAPSRPTPFTNAVIRPILCRSEAATPAAESLNLEKIDEPNRCDYVQR